MVVNICLLSALESSVCRQGLQGGIHRPDMLTKGGEVQYTHG